MTMARPYETITVVEAVSGAPGSALRLGAAMAGRIFADLGATVIVIDDEDLPQSQSHVGSLDRFLGARKSRIRGKMGNRAFLSYVLREADVAILDGEIHRRLQPQDLPSKVALLSLFSGKHADADIPASEFTVAALGGFLNMVGDPNREPLKLGGHQEAYALGLSAFCGLSAALADPANAARPATIRTSLLDVVVWLNWKAVPLEAGAPIPPGRAGAAAEWRILRCADGWIALVYQEPDWPHLCNMVKDERIRQGKFATRQGRLDHAVELAGIIEQSFLSRTRRELHREALSCRLPLGPVWSPQEALADPHNVARGLFEAIAPLPGEDQRAYAPRLPVLWNGASLSNPTEIMAVTTAVGVS